MRGKAIGMCLLALTCSLASSEPDAAARPKVTGIFSDMHYSAEGGDVVGAEVFIMYSNDGYYARWCPASC